MAGLILLLLLKNLLPHAVAALRMQAIFVNTIEDDDARYTICDSCES